MDSTGDLSHALAQTAPKGTERVALWRSERDALNGALAAAASRSGASGVVAFEHTKSAAAATVENRALSPYCYRCPLGLRFPSCAIACADTLDDVLASNAGRIAAVLHEPAMETGGGMITAPPGHLRRVREICDARGAALILDETTVGAGRTGTMWAAEREMVSPDALVASFGGAGITFAGDAFAAGPGNGEPEPGASERFLALDASLGDVRRKAANFADFLAPLRALAHVGDVRQRGLMAGVELVEDKPTARPFDRASRTAERVCELAIERGAAVRSTGDVLVLMPPLSCSDAGLETLIATVRECVAGVTES